MLELSEKKNGTQHFYLHGWQKTGRWVCVFKTSWEKLLLFEINGVKDFICEQSCPASSVLRQLLWKTFAMAAWGWRGNKWYLCNFFLSKSLFVNFPILNVSTFWKNYISRLRMVNEVPKHRIIPSKSCFCIKLHAKSTDWAVASNERLETLDERRINDKFQ